MAEEKEIKKKRKVGRPKKRGPKKKRKSRAKPKPKIYKPKIQWDWKIVAVSNGKQTEYIGKYLSSEEAYAKLALLGEENKKVVFPRKVKNSHTIVSSNDEYLLLEKNRYGDKENQRLRNEYGMLVEHISTNKNWIVIEKIPRSIEETFWVYGYDPRTDRKTFQWIYDNTLIGKINDVSDFKRIMLYKNKVIVKPDNGPLDIIICKTISDAIRFYNLLEEKSNKSSYKQQIFFLGNYGKLGLKRNQLEKELLEQTGWSLKKIRLKSTRS